VCPRWLLAQPPRRRPTGQQRFVVLWPVTAPTELGRQLGGVLPKVLPCSGVWNGLRIAVLMDRPGGGWAGLTAPQVYPGLVLGLEHLFVAHPLKRVFMWRP